MTYPGTHRFYPRADVTIDQNNPTMNTGGADILRLYHYTFNGTVYHTRVLLRFDLSSVASCSSAILHFTQLGEGAYEYSAHPTANIWARIYNLQYDSDIPEIDRPQFWGEDDPTWNNIMTQPYLFKYDTWSGYTTTIWCQSHYLATGVNEFTMDITELIDDDDTLWVTPRCVLIMLEIETGQVGGNNDIRMFFCSRQYNTTGYPEFGTYHWPYIEVIGEFHVEPESMYPAWGEYYVDGANGNDSANGQSESTPWLTMNHAATSMPASSNLHIQNDFLSETRNAIIAPANMPARWLNWVTTHSLIKPNTVPPDTGRRYAYEDTSIDSVMPATVHGLETVIEARYRTIMFLKFDLSGIDVVGKCTLNIPVTDVYYIDDHDGTIKPWVFLMRWADNNWSESTLTYSNNRTTVLGNVIGYWTVPRTTPQTIQIDVSDLVAEAITAEYDTFTLKMYTYDGWSDTEYYVKLGAHDGDSPAWLYFEN